MSKFFYRQFEDRFRGAKEDIQRRQVLYLPVIERLKTLYPGSVLLDLGCGRGEWLELATRNGWQAIGIDLDQGMVEHCHTLKLKVERTDALSYLSAQADETLSVVTGLHIAEHVTFDVLRQMFQETFRTLKPGGIMILETPNPENLVVGTSTFYMDPSHQNPLPPDLLSFLAESCGFHRFKIVRLNESPDFFPADISIKGLLYGVSPDYALMAQKSGSADMVDSVPPWAELEGRGSSLFEAGIAFDIALHRHLDGFAGKQELEAVHRRIEEAQVEYQGAISRLDDEAAAYRQELLMVYNSSSWRLTAPLRLLKKVIRWFIQGSRAWLSLAPGSRPRRLLREALIMVKQSLQKHLWLKTFFLKLLSPFPGIKVRLKYLGSAEFQPISAPLENEIILSRGARDIYEDLKKIMKQENKL